MSDAFYNALCDHQHIEGYEEGYKDGYEAGKRDASSPWHRVEEELPEIGQLILLYYGGGYSIAARTEDEMWERKRYWKLEDGYWERIEDDCYWMPIEPPKEENNGSSRKEASSDL